MSQSTDRQVLTLEDIVRSFLGLAMLHPEKAPKTQRADRDNSMTILGYNQAQEQLRTILSHHGETEEIRALAETRADGQQRPMEGPGGIKMWIAG